MFKKFTTLFSLVVMMSTFAVTPISAATQAASTDTTVSQATTEQSNHTDVAKEETTAATTLPATSDKSSLIPTTQNQKATNQITNAQAQSRAPALRATDWGD